MSIYQPSLLGSDAPCGLRRATERGRLFLSALTVAAVGERGARMDANTMGRMGAAPTTQERWAYLDCDDPPQRCAECGAIYSLWDPDPCWDPELPGCPSCQAANTEPETRR